MTANQTESLTTLQTATRRMNEADSADLDTILALASQRAAALDALAASPAASHAGPAPVLAAIERDGAAILARLAEFRSALRTQLQDLHRESIAVKAYLAPPPY